MPCYFSIVRHGQTIANFGGIVQSRTNGELTAKGIDMAASLGKLLAEGNEKFTRVYSSDLNRCVQTTAHILEKLNTPVPDVTYTPLLRERDYGDWELHPIAMKEHQEAIKNLAPYDFHKVVVPNGETYGATKERAGKFFEEILKIADETGESDTENILAVSHGNLILCLLENLTADGKKYKTENFDEKQLQLIAQNTCRTRFSVGKADSDGIRTISFTHYLDTEHYKYLNL